MGSNPITVSMINIKKKYPPLDAKAICSAESREDTLSLFRDLGQMAKELGVSIQLERDENSPLDSFAQVINDELAKG